MELVIGRDPEIVLSRLAGQIDNEYGQMFIQLLRLAKHDSSTTPLFTDLLEKIENHLEMDRKNKIALTGERLLALFMTLIPIPAILIMSRIVPETMYFLTEVTIGRMITMLSFASMLVWIIIDKIVGGLKYDRESKHFIFSGVFLLPPNAANVSKYKENSRFSADQKTKQAFLSMKYNLEKTRLYKS